MQRMFSNYWAIRQFARTPKSPAAFAARLMYQPFISSLLMSIRRP